MSIHQLSASDVTSLGITATRLSGAGDANKIRGSAVEFEALLIGQVLEKLEQTFARTEDDSADPARDTVSSLGTQAVAQLLARRHAFGIADMLQRALAAEQTAGSTEASPK